MRLRKGVARLCLIFLLPALPAGIRPAAAGPRPARKPPRLVLFSPAAGERTVETDDLSFAFFVRKFYTKAAPRSQEPSGRQLEIEDRREECRCLRLTDWTKIKFRNLRQIEVIYPEDGRAASLRLFHKDGRVQEIPASALHGAERPYPPRFGATVDGIFREFPLMLGDNAPDGWPEERLTRIVLAPPPSPGRTGRRRR